MHFENSLAYAQGLDAQDTLRPYREQFYLPQNQAGEPLIYLTGNSLGLQPKSTEAYVKQELADWKEYGVEGHFEAKNPWFSYHKPFAEPVARIVGAKPQEVVVMNNLTVNLHLMMVSFYQPTQQRFKIMIEGGAFPSDQYAVETQARFHGFDPAEAIVELQPREGEHTLRTEDILARIASEGDALALVMLGGVNYYTGQAFEMDKITQAGHAVGARVGFDLAHAAGNLQLALHDWGVDFAVWCSYKYLNSGPGGVSGAFVHERYSEDANLPRFAGWWGYPEETRFQMKKGFIPMAGAAAWQLSNAPVLSMAAHMASVAMFDEVGMPALRQKSDLLTAYLEFLIKDGQAVNQAPAFEIITPADPKQRGAQLSILSLKSGKALFDYLTEHDVVADWREPNVIRVAPVPLYNTFEEMYRFANILNGFKANG